MILNIFCVNLISNLNFLNNPKDPWAYPSEYAYELKIFYALFIKNDIEIANVFRYINL